MSNLPNAGDLNWGPVLNDYITNVVLAAADNALSDVTTHETASDPHADRAYANTLIATLNSQANLPGGYVQLNGSGHVPGGLVVAGSITNIYDVRANYGATGNGTTDDSAAINNALAAANTAGGGQVWVASGTYAIGSTLVIGANTWLHLDQGATIKRIANPSVPTYMLANFTATSSPGATNILVSGGSWTVGATTQACTVMAFIDATNVTVASANMTHSPANGSCAVLFAGCTTVVTDSLTHYGAAPGGARNSFTNSVVRIEASASNVIPGLLSAVYTGLGCNFVEISNHVMQCTTATDGGGPYCLFSYLCGTHLNSGIGHNNIHLDGCHGKGCANATHLATGPWAFFTCTGNQFINCGTDIPTTNCSSFFGNGTNNIQFDVNTWFTVSGSNSWSGTFQHKRADVNNCQWSCTGISPGTKTDGTVICVIPYTPLSIQWSTCTVHHSAGYAQASVSCDTSGNIRCYGVPSDCDDFHATCLFALDR